MLLENSQFLTIIVISFSMHCWQQKKKITHSNPTHATPKSPFKPISPIPIITTIPAIPIPIHFLPLLIIILILFIKHQPPQNTPLKKIKYKPHSRQFIPMARQNVQHF
ncbi:hypothetical protein KCU81_g386, partial [Aureobasidium melanogenum]